DKEPPLADAASVLTDAFLAQAAPLLRNRDRLGAARSLCAFVEDHLPIHKALLAGGAGEPVRAGMVRAILDAVGRARQHHEEGPLDDLIVFHMASAILNLLGWWLRN